MINLMKYKKIYFLLSILVLLPGIISLYFYGLKLSIDFTGGSVFEFSFEEKVDVKDVSNIFKEKGLEVESASLAGEKNIMIRTKVVDTKKNDEIKGAITEKYKNAKQLSFETVGPSIGKEAAVNAFTALAVASFGILFYIAFSFRHIPKPYSSFKFGASAVIALLHDAFVVLGVFSILGYYRNVEVNALFITAVLTVIGFSVHDTIVVFDRIRENLDKLKGKTFEEVVNYSLVETLNRSLSTSLTVVFTLFSLYLLGGETIKHFVLALLIGIVSGTYSSIFNAAPLLVVWENFKKK